ncbi:MAG: glycoside hydrolase family 3 C-terminal domain-containing protein, partial [Muribaculaceae bacterium]|nr:glycoside hydrolase family 3 C-terminal domain-containing protein [Muribaculaceae bacterium]
RTAMDRKRPFGSMGSDEHVEACRRIGEEGVVLLQNRGSLFPLNLDKIKKIAVIGENAIKMMTVGGGSSSLKARYEVTPLDGLKKRVGNKAEIVYARGYVGDPTGEYNGVVTGQDLNDPRSPEELRDEALRVARDADVVLFFGGLNKSNHQDCEDTDRESLDLPYGQNELIEALAKVNPNLAVINISGTGVAMPWTAKVPAIMQAWYLGNETGNALASVIAGDANPSGKLPYTYYATLDQCGAHKLGEYPGHPGIDELGNKVMDMPYNEGIFVGYRFIDKNKLKPTFPFGHGISYTTFEYGKAGIDKAEGSADDVFTVTIPVTNSGSREGKEVVQLYISDKKSSVERPVKELKGFRKVSLKPGETAEVKFEIGRDALSYFDADKHAWVCEPGEFEALIGASSADIRSKVKFKVK